jgi:hypothetical protein
MCDIDHAITQRPSGRQSNDLSVRAIRRRVAALKERRPIDVIDIREFAAPCDR